MKTCTKCRVKKSINEFGKNKTSKDGYNYWCKTCRKNTYIKTKNGTYIGNSEIVKSKAINVAKKLGFEFIKSVNPNGKTKGRHAKWLCKRCNKTFVKTFAEMHHKKYQCRFCSITCFRSISERLEAITDKHGKIIKLIDIVEETINNKPSDVRYYVKCRMCDVVKNASLKNLEYGKSNKVTGHTAFRCKCSRQSNGEAIISNYLNRLGVSYVREYSPQWAINPKTNGRLRYDFVVKNKMILEYHGDYHYHDETDVNNPFYNDQRRYRDALKWDLAIQNGFKIYTIPFWNFDNIELILNDILHYEFELNVC